METYVLFGLGTLISAMGFMAVYILQGISADIRDVKGQLAVAVPELHDRITVAERRHQDTIIEIDRRVTKVETRCEVAHQERVL